jgi:hypothetical protein
MTPAGRFGRELEVGRRSAAWKLSITSIKPRQIKL